MRIITNHSVFPGKSVQQLQQLVFLSQPLIPQLCLCLFPDFLPPSLEFLPTAIAMREYAPRVPSPQKSDALDSVFAVQQNEPAIISKITTAFVKRQEGLENHSSPVVTPRDWQILAAAELMSKRDVIVVTATGSGKSLCYQLALVSSPGKTILGIFPLLSLMTDQVSASYTISRYHSKTPHQITEIDSHNNRLIQQSSLG